MGDDELIDRIGGLFAYDGGATDSGIKDDALKAELRARTDIEVLLLKALVSFDPTKGYTIRDAKEFLEWIEDSGGLDIDWL